VQKFPNGAKLPVKTISDLIDPLPVLGKVTSHDVAKVAGVSQATVSRVLRNDPKVSQATRERVEQALTQLRYEPHAMARAFRAKRAGAIGVVVARLAYPLYATMLEAIGAKLSSLGHRMMVWDAEYGGDLPASKALRQGLVDGVILLAVTASSDFLQDTSSSSAPVVLLNRTMDDYPSDQVGSDNIEGGRMVAQYFMGHGRKNLALIGGLERATPIRDREMGFRQALEQAGHALSQDHYRRSDSFTYDSGRDSARDLLKIYPTLDAIFCVNDMLALGAIDGIRSLGLRVPQDVWVVGYDDIELSGWDAYGLTTVRQPIQAMVDEAVNLLLAKIANPVKPLVRLKFANELVVRSSSDGKSLRVTCRTIF
jgi:LacI family transcriptional regulator